MRLAPRSTRYRLTVLGLFFALSLASAGSAVAQDLRPDGTAIIYTEIIIPDATPPGQTLDKRVEYFAEGKVVDLAQYLGILYNFLISIAGLVASVMIIIGGVQYLTSAGDAGKIGAAKSRMTNAFMGLVLVLGAYTILKTINPALVTLKVPDLRNVKTEISFLPWCEYILSGDSVKAIPPNNVTPLGGGTTCGLAGIFKVGNEEQACIYAGTCRLVKTPITALDTMRMNVPQQQGIYKTCLQKPSLTAAEVKLAIAKNPSATFGECLGCPDITVIKAKSLSYDTLGNACLGWSMSFARVPSELKTVSHGGATITDGLFHYCYPDGESCGGAFLDCHEITRNQDDGTRGSGIAACSSDSVTCGCEGYDEEPTPVWSKVIGDQTVYFKNYKGPEDHSETHLGGLCEMNPCKAYLDPASGKKPFANGCKGNTGLGRVVNVVSGNFSAIGDCGNL